MEIQRQSIPLTLSWGTWSTVSFYLDRCQVDTPSKLVKSAWDLVHRNRPKIGKVVDFGAGDGRFANYGHYQNYIGYEIDTNQCVDSNIPANAELHNCCAFSETIEDADLCIGNPPFVRNQDLPSGWRAQVSKILRERTGVNISGLANAWQYFFLLALASIKSYGLCVLIVPFEWVSRPSVQALRDYIKTNRWNVKVYRLNDTTFSRVFTTSSITIVDKATNDGVWTYFQEDDDGSYSQMSSPSGSSQGVIKYAPESMVNRAGPRAIRGLSPGTQKVFTLTERERVHFGLEIDSDVVSCITTLRHLPASVRELNKSSFHEFYVNSGKKCWLIVTQVDLSEALRVYLDSILPIDYQTSTCMVRKQWWKFNLPRIPEVLVATSFRGKFPKFLTNDIGARAVGGVCGIHNSTKSQAKELTDEFVKKDIRDQIVSHSNGLRKIEINQLNTLLHDIFVNKTQSNMECSG